MRLTFRCYRLLLVVSLGLTVWGCSGGGGSPTEPPPPGPPAPPPPANATANFDVVSAGQVEMVSYSGANNTIFCTRNAGWASLWIRMARDTTANGDNGPHVDIDLCNHMGGGSFGPQDPAAASCGGAKTFDLFWHAADGSVYSNEPGAPNCSLQLTQNGTQLTATFACRGLTEEGGARTVDVVNGTVACTEM